MQAMRVVLEGTEMFVLSGRLRRKFSELKVGKIAVVTVIEESHPCYECPVVNIKAWNESSRQYQDLKSLLNI